MQGNQLHKKNRIAAKARLCVLGLFVLVLLFLVKYFSPRMEDGDIPPKPPVKPVYQTLKNVWLIEVGEDNLLLYRNGEEVSYDLGAIEVAVDENGEPMWDVPVKEAKRTELHLYQPEMGLHEKLADVTLTNGRVTSIVVKDEKIHGVILGADENGVEIEGYGILPLSKDYRGYRIYNTLAMCTYKDLSFGYDFADLVVQDGEICGILLAREETMENIRVLIKSADFQSSMHEEVELWADTDYRITYGAAGREITEEKKAGEKLVIDRDSPYFAGNRISIVPNALTGKIYLSNVSRSQGIPGYRGHMECVLEEDGIAVINELPLEEYLYSVVPSEMPASYPKEALKAQAICARTYAYGHMQQAAFPAYGAHVDDSTTYQVYNNILENKKTTEAVKETYGQLLFTPKGTVAQTYYYSTSCGVGSDATVWKTEAAAAIDYLHAESISESAMQGKLSSRGEGASAENMRDEDTFAEFIISKHEDDFEVSEGWYRWTYHVKEIDIERMLTVLRKRYEANPKLVLTMNKKNQFVSSAIRDFTGVKGLYVAARGNGGVADELIIETDTGIIKVITEHNIRYVLCDGVTKVVRQNGSKVDMPNLLPSGFFVIDVCEEEGEIIQYRLIGGGFGHGAGMSQNAAKHMAQAGYTCDEILLFFYDNCNVEAMYQRSSA